MPTPQEMLFARFVVDYGLLSVDEEDRCWTALAEARASGDRSVDFPAMAERLDLLSPHQIAGVRVLMRKEAHRQANLEPAPAAAAAREAVGSLSRPGDPLPVRVDVTTTVEAARDPAGKGNGARSTVGGYTILRELGRGGMGIVYEAIQLRLNRRVALKVLASPEMERKGFERLKREALAAAKLSHPNVVQVYDCGEEEGLPYFAMEFVAGKSLAQWIGSPGLTPERSIRFALQAARGLQAAHDAGILHRDIKPANLLVDGKDRLVLTDLGLARDTAAATITQSNQVLGTPRYMSPEQANGVREEVDHRTDVYSLGATLYEMATGKPIFDEADGHILHQVLFRDPRPPRRHRPDLAVDLETVILKATAKEASHRYASCAELAEDLERLLDSRKIAARRVPLPIQAWRQFRRHRRISAIVIPAAIFAALGESALQRSDPADAKRAFERARLIDPAQWRPCLGLGLVAAASAEWEVAQFRCIQAIDLGLNSLDLLEAPAELAPLRSRPEYRAVRERFDATRKDQGR